MRRVGLLSPLRRDMFAILIEFIIMRLNQQSQRYSESLL